MLANFLDALSDSGLGETKIDIASVDDEEIAYPIEVDSGSVLPVFDEVSTETLPTCLDVIHVRDGEVQAENPQNESYPVEFASGSVLLAVDEVSNETLPTNITEEQDDEDETPDAHQDCDCDLICDCELPDVCEEQLREAEKEKKN